MKKAHHRLERRHDNAAERLRDVADVDDQLLVPAAAAAAAVDGGGGGDCFDDDDDAGEVLASRTDEERPLSLEACFCRFAVHTAVRTRIRKLSLVTTIYSTST